MCAHNCFILFLYFDTACEVVCGDIDETFLYYTDNLVSSGANLMCQVILSFIEDLKKRLQERGQKLPRKGIFQFDNSGENKNKEVNALMSTLIELVFFDEIHCNFLVVGHTHCSVDQYFGVCTKVIQRKHWIGSAMSFQSLLKIAHNDPKRRPTVNRQIVVIFDFRNYFAPIINKIGWCQVPHCFKFTKYLGKAIMQYKMFSPNQFWLPEAPDIFVRTADDLMNHSILNINLNKFCTIGQESDLHQDLNIHNRFMSESVSDVKLRNTIASFSNIRPFLEVMEQTALIQHMHR